MQVMENTTAEKIIYFVRHGQSKDNNAPVFQGIKSELSKEGKTQAEFIAKRASNLSFDALISSPLERAKETAKAISKTTNKPIEYSELFVERVKPSELNDRPYHDHNATELWRAWQESTYTPGKRVDDGENFDDIIKRTDRALAHLYDHSERSIVVVTHGYFLRAIVARVVLGDALSAESYKNFHQGILNMENTGVSVLLYEGAFEQEPGWRLSIYNDHAHLAQ